MNARSSLSGRNKKTKTSKSRRDRKIQRAANAVAPGLALAEPLEQRWMLSFTPISQPTAIYTNQTHKIALDGSSDVSSINDGTETLNFSQTMDGETVPAGWATWGSPPNTESAAPNVLRTSGASTVTITPTIPVIEFGVEMEEESFTTENLTASFYDGAVSPGNLIGTVTRSVNGNAGALLFAASTDTGHLIQNVVLSTPGDDFAFAEPRYLIPSAASISGIAFDDTNGDGIDESEPGLQSVILTLEEETTPGNPATFAPVTPNGTTTTNASGAYSFTGLSVGTYEVVETVPPNSTATTPVTSAAFTVVDGTESFTGVNFGSFHNVTISGEAFDDLNDSGINNPNTATDDTNDPGVEGVTIDLYLNDSMTVTATTTTDSNGNYSFPDEGPGFYTITQVVPEGYLPSTPTSVSFTTSSSVPVPSQDFGEASQIIVTNTNDSGVGSLRQAILNANADDASDTILFDIPGSGVQTITPLTDLPEIEANNTYVDAATQPGYAGTPLIQISGAVVQDDDGLDVTGGNVAIRAFVINGFDTQIEFDDVESGQVAASYIGVDPTGTKAVELPLDETTGISVEDCEGVVIGGIPTADRNIISGNYVGIYVDGLGISVLNNYIGTDVTGFDAIPNAYGISIGIFGDGGGPGGEAFETTIGLPGEGNVISGNGWGVYDDGCFTYYEGNYIGVASDGMTPLGNQQSGITLFGSGDEVGGLPTDVFFSPNVIANNGSAGVGVADGSDNLILSNSIYANVGLGIDLGLDGVTPNNPSDQDGPNELMPFPVLTSAVTSLTTGDTVVTGTLTCNSDLGGTEIELQFFTTPAPDSSGYGEGATLYATTDMQLNVNGSLTFSLDFPNGLPAGTYLSATATPINPEEAPNVVTAGQVTSQPAIPAGIEEESGTSEFAQTITVTNPPPPPPPPPVVTIDDVTEYEPTTANTPYDFTLTRTGDTSGTTVVTLGTKNGTATAQTDYLSDLFDTVTFLPGATTETVVITVNGGEKLTSDVDFKVDLFSITNGTLGNDQGIGTILVLPTLSINNVSMNEGNSGLTPFVFTVTRSGDLTLPSSVAYTTHGVTATAGSDYQSTSGTLNFAAGQATATITVEVIGDTTVESNETFDVLLSAPSGATITNGTGVGTIINDDFPPASLTPSSVSITGNEGRIINPTVATFTAASSAATGEFSASINWGDGSSASSGTIVKDSAGKFHITGSHEYAEENYSGYAVTVTIKDSSGPTKTVTDKAIIDDSPLDEATGLSLSKSVNTTYTNLVLGSFRDQDSLNSDAGDYNISINWGDGSAATTGKAVKTGSTANVGTFWNVEGTHKYTTKKTYTVKITVYDTGNPAKTSITITTTIKIS